MRLRSSSLLALTLASVPLASASAQVSLRDLPEVARARAERLRPKQIAALEPFWADLALTYEGTHSVTAWVEAGEEAQFEIPGHVVRYRGEFDASGDRLRGEWRIRCGDEAGEGDAVGAFELLRQ